MKEIAKVKGDILEKIPTIMDRNLQINDHILDDLLDKNKGNEYYTTISQIMEEAFIEGLGIEE